MKKIDPQYQNKASFYAGSIALVQEPNSAQNRNRIKMTDYFLIYSLSSRSNETIKIIIYVACADPVIF
jgi:hypothetical protein